MKSNTFMGFETIGRYSKPLIFIFWPLLMAMKLLNKVLPEEHPWRKSSKKELTTEEILAGMDEKGLFLPKRHQI